MHWGLRLLWWLVYLPYSLVRDIAKFSLAMMGAFLVLFCVVSLAEPLGDFGALAVLVGFMFIFPALVEGWSRRPAPQSSASGSEQLGQALSLPDGPIPERARGVTEVYRGDLTTLPPG